MRLPFNNNNDKHVRSTCCTRIGENSTFQNPFLLASASRRRAASSDWPDPLPLLATPLEAGMKFPWDADAKASCGWTCATH
jgi:hypothetical protein